VKRVVYHRLAARELIASAEFYEPRRAGLGDVFLDAVEATTRALRAHPATGRQEPHDTRSMRVKRFPYRLFYTVQSDRIWIVAVAHPSRRPGYWSRRLV
jgi:plasmid stabilization system protein ParE